jgi:hypothetical protein
MRGGGIRVCGRVWDRVEGGTQVYFQLVRGIFSFFWKVVNGFLGRGEDWGSGGLRFSGLEEAFEPEKRAYRT